MDEKSYLVSVPTPLGIGFKRVENGFVVSKVKPGGNAEEEGGIEVGTKILTVNGNATDGLLKEEVSALIKASKEQVCVLKICDPPARKSSIYLGFEDDSSAVGGAPPSPASTAQPNESAARNGGVAVDAHPGLVATGRSEGNATLGVDEQRPKENATRASIEKKKKKEKTATKHAVFELSVPLPLGLSYKKDEGGIYRITKLKPDGNAAATGRVIPGLEILSVNGTLAAGLERDEMGALIRGSNLHCVMELRATRAKRSEARSARPTGASNPAKGASIYNGVSVGGSTLDQKYKPVHFEVDAFEQGSISARNLMTHSRSGLDQEAGRSRMIAMVAIGLAVLDGILLVTSLAVSGQNWHGEAGSLVGGASMLETDLQCAAAGPNCCAGCDATLGTCLDCVEGIAARRGCCATTGKNPTTLPAFR